MMALPGLQLAPNHRAPLTGYYPVPRSLRESGGASREEAIIDSWQNGHCFSWAIWDGEFHTERFCDMAL